MNTKLHLLKTILMKHNLPIFRVAIIGLFVTLSVNATAQQTPDPTIPVTVNADLKTGTINDDGATALIADAVLYYVPGSGSSITLVASDTDENGKTFSHYAWYEVNADGTEGATVTPTDPTNPELALTELGPGYHRYRVYGFVDDGSVCMSSEYQDMILYVLNPLATSATTAAIEAFCKDETGTLEMEAEVNFGSTHAGANLGTSGSNPSVGELSKKYTLYAMYDDGTNPAVRVELDDVTVNAATNEFEVSYAQVNNVGSYTFFVEVEYNSAIKDKGARPEGHGFWTAQVQKGGNPYVLTVTEKPGRPTITIKANSIVD